MDYYFSAKSHPPLEICCMKLSWKHLPTPVRPDRDDFIKVNFKNILPKLGNNFVKRPLGNARSHAEGSVNPKNTPYDVRSVNQMWKEVVFIAIKFFIYPLLPTKTHFWNFHDPYSWRAAILCQHHINTVFKVTVCHLPTFLFSPLLNGIALRAIWGLKRRQQGGDYFQKWCSGQLE